MAKVYTFFRPKLYKNHSLWGRIYLYNLYKGVAPGILVPKKKTRQADIIYSDTYLIEFLPSDAICWFQQITGHFSEIFHIFLGAHVALFSIEVGQCNEYLHGYNQVPAEDLWWPLRVVFHGLSEAHEL